MKKARLLVSQILSWAEAHQARTGRWPRADSGRIREAPGETWVKVNIALREGGRGLKGGSSLARLLRQKRNVHAGKNGLDIETILAWADAHRARTGFWPKNTSGEIPGSGGETWQSVNSALYASGRGLPGGSSLARLLAARRGIPRYSRNEPPLVIDQILAWADAHQERTGSWPRSDSGRIGGVLGETWSKIDTALRSGRRGLAGGSSLARLLVERRGLTLWGRRDIQAITVNDILAWADEYRARTGAWPRCRSGRIPGRPGLSWASLDKHLNRGRKPGLPGGTTLARLLGEHRPDAPRSPFTAAQILDWADAWHARTGHWPTDNSGGIPERPGLTWGAVDHALQTGKHGLQRSSVAALLAEHRGVYRGPNHTPLTMEQILVWADAHRARTGKWPNRLAGDVAGVPGERWCHVDDALRQGKRGLRQRTTLVRLLFEQRGVRRQRPALTVEQILGWADLHRQRTGGWPHAYSGRVPEAPGEVWANINSALVTGGRGLPRRSSLARLLAEERGAPYRPSNNRGQPPLSIKQILRWAQAHYDRHGRWPSSDSGSVLESPSDTWKGIDAALAKGFRNLPGNTTLSRLLRGEVRT